MTRLNQYSSTYDIKAIIVSYANLQAPTIHLFPTLTYRTDEHVEYQ